MGPPPPPLCESNALARAAAGVVSIHFGTGQWEEGGASLFPLYCTAADDYDVASSPMQKVILHSLPTEVLRKAPTGRVRLLTSLSLFPVICMCCALC